MEDTASEQQQDLPSKRLGTPQGWNQFGDEYDFPPFAGTPKLYLIASTPRSGSHFLSHLLFACGDLGSPLEYLNPGRQSAWRELLDTSGWADTLRAQIQRRTSPSGWFGLKAHWSHFDGVRGEPGMDTVLQFNCAIRLRRENTISQAVSLVIAQQTQAWISHFKPERSPVYDFTAIRDAHRLIKNEDAQWDQYFSGAGITHLQVTYEDLIAAPDAIVERIRSALGLGPATKIKHQEGPRRQSSELNDAWCSRYLTEFNEAAS